MPTRPWPSCAWDMLCDRFCLQNGDSGSAPLSLTLRSREGFPFIYKASKLLQCGICAQHLSLRGSAAARCDAETFTRHCGTVNGRPRCLKSTLQPMQHNEVSTPARPLACTAPSNERTQEVLRSLLCASERRYRAPPRSMSLHERQLSCPVLGHRQNGQRAAFGQDSW